MTPTSHLNAEHASPTFPPPPWHETQRHKYTFNVNMHFKCINSHTSTAQLYFCLHFIELNWLFCSVFFFPNSLWHFTSVYAVFYGSDSISDPDPSQHTHTFSLYLVYWTIRLIGLINVQSATSAAGSCLPSTLAVRTGTATGVLGIISNFKSVLLAVGGHLVATWEHIALSAVCTYSLIQFGLGTRIPPSLTAIFEPPWAAGVVNIYHLASRLPPLLALKQKIPSGAFDHCTAELNIIDL